MTDKVRNSPKWLKVAAHPPGGWGGGRGGEGQAAGDSCVMDRPAPEALRNAGSTWERGPFVG